MSQLEPEERGEGNAGCWELARHRGPCPGSLIVFFWSSLVELSFCIVAGLVQFI